MPAKRVRDDIGTLTALVRERDEPRIIAAITGLTWDALARIEINPHLAEIALNKGNSLAVREHAAMAIDDPKVLLTLIARDVDQEIAGKARAGLAVHLD